MSAKAEAEILFYIALLAVVILLTSCSIAPVKPSGPPMPPALPKLRAASMSIRAAAAPEPGRAPGGNPQVHRESVALINVGENTAEYAPGMVISFTNGPGVWRIERSTNLVNWELVGDMGPYPTVVDVTGDPCAFFRLTPLN